MRNESDRIQHVMEDIERYHNVKLSSRLVILRSYLDNLVSTV